MEQHAGKPDKPSDQNEDASKTDTRVTAKIATIFYIEDNIANVRLVKEFLESQLPGILLITTAFGKLAVELANDHVPDLILLDINLPDIKGSDVLHNLQADDLTKSIPVVIITADAMPQQVEKLLAAGARDYLTKPLDAVLLLQVVDWWIGFPDVK